jgi:catechol 2,3-dioxygenase-like lactoylglutathione lyase family enzyme
MSLPVTFDHCVIHVSEWERANVFYRDVFGAELVRREAGWAYRFGDKQLNVHGPGVKPAEVARLPVQPGNSGLCLEWHGPIAEGMQHLEAHGAKSRRGLWSASAPRGTAPASISGTPTGR